ncbi:MAG: FliH/SctL family protein [Alphaproteobacteria bacterium]|nr:FliH/SctL family protein [Alphaproteobacteria bacterium]
MSTEPLLKDKKGMPPGTPVRKFMFERSFDDAAVVHRAPERKPVLMKPEQIDALKKESYDTGFGAGKTAGKDDQTALLTATLAKVEQNVSVLIEHIGALAQEQEEQIRRLSLAALKKILPTFTAQSGMMEIEALINDTIREMSREPRLVVRVHEGEFDALNERIEEIATKRAYSGKVIVLADDTVAAGDCRIEWADGGAYRDTQKTLNAIAETILPSS